MKTDQELRQEAFENFLHSGTLANDQCANWLREMYFKIGFKAACEIKNKEIEKRNALLEKADRYMKEIKTKHFPYTTNSFVDEWFKDYEALKGTKDEKNKEDLI